MIAAAIPQHCRPTLQVVVTVVAALVGLCSLVGCDPDTGPTATLTADAARTTAAGSNKQTAQDGPPAKAGQAVNIPPGRLLAGSPPNQEGKDHRAEPDEIPLAVTGFEMDLLPYPNDPSIPPRTGVAWKEADALCRQRGKRLCTDVEWERACKGDTNQRYPYGDVYRPEAYEHLGPRSPFGVRGMGRIAEWTLSPWIEISYDTDIQQAMVVRGVIPGHADADTRRCSRRTSLDPAIPLEGLGFRCCKGKVPAAQISVEPPHNPWRELTFVEADDMARILKQIPELGHLKSPRFFSPDDLRIALIRGSTEPRDFPDFLFTWRAIRWTPVRGMDLWVFAGASDTSSFVVALYRSHPKSKFFHAASLTFHDTPVPLMLVAKKGHRDEIWWGFCWGCRESGSIKLNDQGRVIITHKW